MATKEKSRKATQSSRRRKTSRRTAASGKARPAPVGRSRPIWSGNLRLALVSVPVNIYPATRTGARISFHQIHEPSGKRIRYRKVVPGIGTVDADDIVKGFDLGDGDYVLIDPDELEEIRIETKKTLDLVQFVEQGEIDPIWYDRPYYITADGELAEEAYAILRAALKSSNRIGLGQLVMRGREHIAAIKPCGQGLLLETLRFADEVRNAAPYFSSIADDAPDKELLDLAQELIERKTAPFDPNAFKDSYTEAVRALIDAKAAKKSVHIDDAEPTTGGAQVIDLVDALKRSVRNAKGKGSSANGKRQRKAS